MEATTGLTTIQCGRCGVVFAVPTAFYRSCKRDKKTWYCPSGHGQVFVRTTTEELEEAHELIARLRTMNSETMKSLLRIKKRLAKLQGRRKK